MFSVIVPTFNRAPALGHVVDSLLAQDASISYEVIVVDNNSTDDTRERTQALIEKTGGRLRYVLERQRGCSAVRNSGIAAARGSIIAFIDDDAVAHPRWLEALARTYRDYPDAWCVGGRIVLQLPPAVPRWFDPGSWNMVATLSGLDLGDATIKRDYPNDVWGANFSVRRRALEQVGLFDTRLGPIGSSPRLADETELCWRIQEAGGAVYYCGTAAVTHIVPETRLTKRYFRKRAYWVGRTWGLLDRRDVVAVHPRQFPRAAASGMANWVKSVLLAGRPQTQKAFDAELESWFAMGYICQRFVMAVTRHPGVGRSAPGRPGLRSVASRTGR